MDLAFTPDEQKFRETIRAWVGEHLPADISHKVHNALQLRMKCRQDLDPASHASASNSTDPIQAIKKPPPN